MLGMDPFSMIDEDLNDDESAEDDEVADGVDFINQLNGHGEDDELNQDMMLDGGMHLMADKRKLKANCNAFAIDSAFEHPQQRDCVTKVADECIDLNQFITKMDELVYSQHGRASSIGSQNKHNSSLI